VKLSLQSSAPLSRVRVYRQDPLVSEPSEEIIDKVSIGRRLSGPRMEIVTGRGEFKARADEEGNYLYPPGSGRLNQVHAFVVAQKTLDLFEGYANRSLPWAFEGEQLGVIPHAGDGRNAYYARWNKSVAFYSFDSTHLQKKVYVAQSAEVVSHETGHAILDGMKPQWGKTFDRETKAMHEAFSDAAAMLLTVSKPENRAQALAETGGDLRQDNVISSIAEEFGKAVRLANRDPDDDRPYLRDSNNDFTYLPPSQLPRNGSREELSADPHSFCQVFTRAFYNALVGVYEQKVGRGVDPDQALRGAGDDLGVLLTQGVTMSSPNRARFADVALAMLRADSLSGGGNQQPLRTAFLESRILGEEHLERLKEPLPQGTPDEVLAVLGLEGYTLSRTVVDGNGLQTLEYGYSNQDTRSDLLGLMGLPISIDVAAGVSLTYNAQGDLVHVASQKADPKTEWSGVPENAGLFAPSEQQDAQLVSWENGYKLEKLVVFRD
jgi:hypothetical protein